MNKICIKTPNYLWLLSNLSLFPSECGWEPLPLSKVHSLSLQQQPAEKDRHMMRRSFFLSTSHRIVVSAVVVWLNNNNCFGDIRARTTQRAKRCIKSKSRRIRWTDDDDDAGGIRCLLPATSQQQVDILLVQLIWQINREYVWEDFSPVQESSSSSSVAWQQRWRWCITNSTMWPTG